MYVNGIRVDYYLFVWQLARRLCQTGDSFQMGTKFLETVLQSEFILS